MEIIRLEGYTEDEKVEIAQRHLIAKQIDAHGLKEGEFEVTEAAVRDLIRYYTREAGVRTLEREVARLARKALRKILEGVYEKVVITPETLADYAGVRKFRHGVGEEEHQIGAVTGLAWTEVGGELMDLLHSIAGWVARKESNRRSERTKAGLQRAVSQGKRLGRPPGSKDRKKRSRRGYFEVGRVNKRGSV
jgi:ATP-dependent Lon protease